MSDNQKNPNNMSATAAAITAAASLGGGIMSAIGQNKQTDKMIAAQSDENRRAEAHNLMLAQQQNEWNQAQWERELEASREDWLKANDPKEIRKRLAAAGMNPDLAYSQDGSPQALTPHGPEMTAGQGTRPQDMSALGQKQTIGDALQQTLQNELTRAQIQNVKQNTEKSGHESDILKSDAAFRDALNTGTIKLNDVEFEIKSDRRLYEAQLSQIREKTKEIQQTTENLRTEQELFRSRISNLDTDTAIKKIEEAFKANEIKAQINEIVSRTNLNNTQASDLVKTLVYRQANLQADTKLKTKKGITETWKSIETEYGIFKLDVETDILKLQLDKLENPSFLEDINDILKPIATIFSIITPFIL